MTSSRVRYLIEQHVQAVCLPLYEGVSTGVGQAIKATSRMSSVDYPWLLACHARAAIRDQWLLAFKGSAWRVEGRPQLMGQTILVNSERNISLRLMKENRRVHPGGVPTAGRGRTRRSLWQDPLPGMVVTSAGEPVLDGVAACLLLWNVEQRSGSPVISVRVVHTVGPGLYGRRVPIDMSFAITPQGQMFEDLGFRGDPQDGDLFPDISEEENEGGFGS